MPRIPESVERAIGEIRADRFSGARSLTARAAEVLTQAAALDPNSIPEVARRLSAAQPVMAPIYNLASRAAASNDVPGACRQFLDGMDRATRRIASAAAALIPEGATVMTHSASSTVLDAFRAAREEGRSFHVIATESRPQCEGVTMAERVAALGVPVTLIADAAIYRTLAGVQLAYVGADAISAKALANKTGTALLALAASRLRVPCYALAGSERCLPAGYEPPAEPPKDPRELLPRDVPGVGAENYYFEWTPLELLTGIISETGLIAPAVNWLA